MSKKTLCFFLIIIIGLFCTACKKNKSLILFNHYPITKDNILNNSTVFTAGERIYYVYLTRKELKTEDIRVKIYKRNWDAKGAYGDVVYSNDFRLKKGEIFYFTDYIVMHKAGNYIMHVYKKDYLWKPDAIADFRVDAR